MAVDTMSEDVSVLKAEVATLRELLAVQEQVVVEQSARLGQTFEELRQAKEAADASEVWLRSVIETINDWVWEVNGSGVYTYVSPRVRDILGYAPEEVIGRTPFDLMPPEEAAQLGAVFAELIAARQPLVSLANINLHKDGRRLVLETSGMPFFAPDGTLMGYRGVDRDITERRQAEEKLERYADDLERANDEVKQFAYIVSHDLRAPLINLRGFAAELHAACDTVKSLLPVALPHLDEEQRLAATEALGQAVPEALEFIGTSITRMDGLISAVLRLSRLGRSELHFETVRLGEVVQAALDGLAHRIDERQVQVTVGPLPEVIADRTAMDQIVGNILTNAVNYLEPSRRGEIEIGGAQRGPEVSFFVRDNGRGIAESDMSKVFALFRRAGRQDVQGEGMGLAYAQTLAHRHGGYIRCESQEGGGTTFTVVVSAHAQKEEPAHA